MKWEKKEKQNYNLNLNTQNWKMCMFNEVMRELLSDRLANLMTFVHIFPPSNPVACKSMDHIGVTTLPTLHNKKQRYCN